MADYDLQACKRPVQELSKTTPTSAITSITSAMMKNTASGKQVPRSSSLAIATPKKPTAPDIDAATGPRKAPKSRVMLMAIRDD
jgi:hypothetical protein